MTLEPIFRDWRLYNDLITRALGEMSVEDLAICAPSSDATSSTSWPIWAIAGHAAAVRVYWLCVVMGVPGAESTPFSDMNQGGWEDDLDHPRTVDELVIAWKTTWGVVEHALRIWTPTMLEDSVAVGGGDSVAHLTRRSLLLRLITHEAYHVGEIAVIQAIHGRPQVDLWPPGFHTVEAEASRESVDRGSGGAR